MPTHSVRSIVFEAVRAAAEDFTVRTDIIANHDDNRWWPLRVTDWRLRLVFAGWSTRISYNMIRSFQRTIDAAEMLGFDSLAAMSDEDLARITASLGMVSSRVRYFRSVRDFVEKVELGVVADPRSATSDAAIHAIRANIWGASYKVAQCAVLYVKGYHCGIFPVDSGMVAMLGPCLGLTLSRGDIAHEDMRKILEYCINTDAARYHDLIDRLDYSAYIKVPASAPVWWAHLALIYFKRRFCNRHRPEECALRNTSAGACIGSMCSSESPKRGGVRKLIIEGVDGVGKSSVAAALAEDGFNLRHFPYDRSNEDLAKTYRDRIANSHESEIWDRSFISEYVYGTALRGASRLSLDTIVELGRLFVANGGAIAILIADADEIALRMQKDGRAEEFDSVRHTALAEQYGIVAALLADAGLISVFNTNGFSAAEVRKRMVGELSLWRKT